MAFLASRSLSSRFGPHVCVGRIDAFSGPVTAYVPSPRSATSGSSAQSQSGFGASRKQASSTRHHRPLVTSVAVPDVALEAEEESVAPEDDNSPLTPTSFEVQSLLMELCDETSIAELQLKVGGFKLSVKRDVAKLKSAAPAVPAVPPPVPSKPMVDSLPAGTTASPAASKTSNSTALVSSASKPLPSVFALLESAADEGLLFVKSPKVGYFRKGRVAKGKSGPPLCEEGQIIKEGHVVCYLEQLGTQQPVESDISGEVVKVLWDDGEPVGYGDPLIAIRPSFPGIKKLT
ncbi:hypothetical protein R1sor_027262 [Riccia sorocarpa]|uniref:Lipoyl-binding domain-containing protein n=1 Tax=Riccia sorocarpa TaxID=122646 RepID=A0ABD3GJG4_9MARC